MKRPVTSAVLLLALGACGGGGGPSSGSPLADGGGEGGGADAEDDNVEPGWANPAYCAVDLDRVEAILDAMSLERKAAQVLIVGVTGSGSGPAQETSRKISEIGVGGVFLPPLQAVQLDPVDTARLVRAMQQEAVAATGIPLFVTLDHEGGHAAVLNTVSGATDTPGSMALGQAVDPVWTFDCFDVMGTEAAALGFNMDFAPVLDVLPDPANGAMNTRGFGATAGLVAALAPPAVWGLQNHLVLGTAKHFPGVGLTAIDTHADLPVVEVSEEEFRATTLVPFAEAIRAGADALMTGHVVYSTIDPDYPASMSEVILRGLVREELGFTGLIVTDSIGMAGALLGAGDDGPTVRALIAGNDMVLAAGADYEGTANQVAEIVAAVGDGRLAEADLDAAVRRILAYKMKYCAFENPFPDPEAVRSLVGTQENLARTQTAANHTIVLWREEPGMLPLTPDAQILFIGPDRWYQDPGSGWFNIVDRTFGEVLERYSSNVTRFEVVLPPAPSSAAGYLPLAEAADVIVMATINAHYSTEQVEFLRPALEVGKPVVLVTLGVPYDAWELSGAGTIMNATGQRSVSMEAAAAVLFGQIEALGTPAVEMTPADGL